MRVTLISYGTKHESAPPVVDLVIDCTSLPNPYNVPALRPLTGQDARVIAHCIGDSLDWCRLVSVALDAIHAASLSGASSYSVACHCIGGRHRSVALADHLATVLRDGGHVVLLNHRSLP